MKSLAILNLLLIHVCHSGRFSREVGDSCKTPSPGVCRNIRNCPVVLEYVKASAASPAAFLRQFHCGFEGRDPLVCCPGGTSYNPSPTGPTGASSPSRCGISRFQPDVDKIVGGTDAALGSWPWMAALGYRSRSKSGVQWLCGGALVTKQHVVTAAHCVVTPPDKTLSVVRLGDLNLIDGVNDGASPVDIQIERVITHPDYRTNAQVNDVAVVKLRNSAQFTDTINPICLPDTTQLRSDLLLGRSPYVIGWGSLYFQERASPHLQQVDVPVVDEKTCRDAFKNQRKAVIDNRVICAGSSIKDACQGDSGGPLMLDVGSQFYLVGVVSYGHECAKPGFPGVYTRISTFVDWINKQIH